MYKIILQLLRVIYVCLTILCYQLSFSQSLDYSFDGKKLGLYISSTDIDYSDHYYLPISQFLTIGENRSAEDKMKTEFLIRLGEMLSEQIAKVTNADTVYFINANVSMGKAIRNAYNKDTHTLISVDAFFDMDYMIMIDELKLTSFKKRSVFIRSNQMYSEPIDVKRAEMHTAFFQQSALTSMNNYQTCMDESIPYNEELYFNFFSNKSAMGNFLSKLFSSWWDQLLSNQQSNCNT